LDGSMQEASDTVAQELDGVQLVYILLGRV
jgi:hypothetical protein